MADKKIVLLLNANQEYIRHIQDDDLKKYAPEINGLFEAITNTYLPLLDMFERLESENVPFRIQMVMSPVLCTLLEDTVVQAQYVSFLDRAIALGEKEVKRNAKNKKVAALSAEILSHLKKCRTDFTERYLMRILPKFAEFQKKGFVELMATCGTSVFLPYYNDLPEILSAQVETGISSHKHFFGEIPDGFWLPELGYAPGIENIVRSYGFNYTVLDPRSTLFASEQPENGVFYPCRFNNSLVAFSVRNDADEMLFGEEGFASAEVYRNENRDISFDLSSKDLALFIESGSPRYASGFKYFNKSVEMDDNYAPLPADDSEAYDTEKAMEQVQKDALKFLEVKNAELSKASEIAKDVDFVSEICVIDLDRMRRNWVEGIKWIEALFRNAASFDFEFDTCRNQIKNQYNLQKITPYYASSLGAGYGENLLSNKNCWMMRYVRKASERMIDLADRFPTDTGLKARLLDLAAKELMIAQSSGWAKMLDDDISPEYVKKVFSESINAFTMVFDSLGSNTVSTEWLTNLEAEHPLFPWMNYRIFSKKQ